MTTTKVKISPRGFERVVRILWRADLDGLDPTSAARTALVAVGLIPRENVETIFEVDASLDGCVYPFEDRPCVGMICCCEPGRDYLYPRHLSANEKAK